MTMVHQPGAVDFLSRENSPEKEAVNIVDDSNEDHFPADEIAYTEIQ